MKNFRLACKIASTKGGENMPERDIDDQKTPLIPKNHPDEYAGAPPPIVIHPLVDPVQEAAAQPLLERIRLQLFKRKGQTIEG